MSKIDWNKLSKNIPPRVRIAAKIFYEVLFIKDFHGQDLWGESRPDTNQIVLKSNLSSKIMVETYIHECFHAWSDHHDINLTETQILALEKAIPYMLQTFRQLESNNE